MVCFLERKKRSPDDAQSLRAPGVLKTVFWEEICGPTAWLSAAEIASNSEPLQGRFIQFWIELDAIVFQAQILPKTA